jgi:hypothetical protein
MTLITWNGGPIFRDGAVATEQACCCEPPPPPPPPNPCTCDDCRVSDFLQEGTPSCLDGSGFDIFQGYQRSGLLRGSNGPAGVEYAEGYPEILGYCWFWWQANNSCVVAVGSLGCCGAYSYAGTIREKWTLYACKDGEYIDITSTATTNGPFTSLTNYGGGATGSESVACGGVVCPDDPNSDFLEPIIDCNPLP